MTAKVIGGVVGAVHENGGGGFVCAARGAKLAGWALR